MAIVVNLHKLRLVKKLEPCYMKNTMVLLLLICASNYIKAQIIFTLKDNGTVVQYSDFDLRGHKDRCSDGIRVAFDSLGEIFTEVRYKNCLRNGIARRYYSNGVIESLGTYIDHKKDGKWFYWYSNGKLRLIELYNKGLLVKNKKRKK